MRTLGYFHLCIFLTTAIAASFELLKSDPSSDVVQRSGSIREAGVMRSLRSTHNQEEYFALGEKRKEDFGCFKLK